MHRSRPARMYASRRSSETKFSSSKYRRKHMGLVSGILGSIFFPLLVFGLIIIYNGARVLAEYERGVVFRLGRLIDVKGPGFIVLIPFVDRMVRIELRTIP